MKGYWICVYEKIDNSEKLNEYAGKARPAVEKYSGKFLTRGGKSLINEGNSSPRTVVVEFLNYDMAIECYDSPEYQLSLIHISEPTRRQHQIVEGV